MSRTVREAVAPLYLLLCLVIGGSMQGVWWNMTLQLIGLAILAWAALAHDPEGTPRNTRLLFWCVILGLGVVVLQLVPLPPSLWQNLGGREVIARGYRLLGHAPPALPLSLTPYTSVATLLTLIPPLAMLAAVIRLGTRPLWLVAALLAGTMGGIMLGALQVSSADPQNSPWYLYAQTNRGFATGFFANANHMATLLLITMPFLAALVAAARGSKREVQRYSAVVALVAGAGLVVFVGLGLNSSLAGYGLAVPTLVGSALIVMPKGSRARRWSAIAAAVLLVAAVVGLATAPIGASASRLGADTSVASRQEIFATTAKAAGEFMPFGSGLGSFRRVYALYEDHERLDPSETVNHAHNDYLELALETGLPGVAVLLLFLLWWARTVWGAWRVADASPYARAASIASAAVLAHSLVDYPLRTAAIGACFAMCLGLLVQRRAPKAADESQLWPTRHIVVGQ